MKLLRLPSGEVFNIEKVLSAQWVEKWNDSITAKIKVLNVSMNESGDGGYSWSRSYDGADARALYAWLEANSTPIGEDGREMTNDTFVVSHLAKNMLHHLRSIYPQGMYATPMSDDWGIEVDDQLDLAENNIIVSTPNGWVITTVGRAAIEGRQ